MINTGVKPYQVTTANRELRMASKRYLRHLVGDLGNGRPRKYCTHSTGVACSHCGRAPETRLPSSAPALVVCLKDTSIQLRGTLPPTQWPIAKFMATIPTSTCASKSVIINGHCTSTSSSSRCCSCHSPQPVALNSLDRGSGLFVQAPSGATIGSLGTARHAQGQRCAALLSELYG